MIPCFQLLQKPMWEKMHAISCGKVSVRTESYGHQTFNQVHVRNWKLMTMVAKLGMKWMSDSNLIDYMWPFPEVNSKLNSFQWQSIRAKPVKMENSWPDTCITFNRIPNKILCIRMQIAYRRMSFADLVLFWPPAKKNTRRFAWFVLHAHNISAHRIHFSCGIVFSFRFDSLNFPVQFYLSI